MLRHIDEITCAHFDDDGGNAVFAAMTWGESERGLTSADRVEVVWPAPLGAHERGK